MCRDNMPRHVTDDAPGYGMDNVPGHTMDNASGHAMDNVPRCTMDNAHLDMRPYFVS